jgi:hypothetical protein
MPLQEVAYVGDTLHADAHAISYDAMTGANIARTARPTIFSGTGAPTFSAPQGSMYLRIDGGVNTRVYINTNGTTGWTPLTNAA